MIVRIINFKTTKKNPHYYEQDKNNKNKYMNK